MATVKIEGKEVTLPDDVVKAGADAIRAVLAANGFPAIEKAHIEIVGAKDGAPAVVKVSPRSTGKGNFHPDLAAKLGVDPEDASSLVPPREREQANSTQASLDTAREIVVVARFLAEESGVDFEKAEVDDRFFLLGIATEVLKARSWLRDEDFDAE